jgi:rubredoxin
MPCIRCSYDLRGSIWDRAAKTVVCPECGEENYVYDLTEPLPEVLGRRQVLLLALTPLLPLIGACLIADTLAYVACVTAVFWVVYLVLHCWLVYIAAKPRSQRDVRFTALQTILLSAAVVLLDSAAMAVFFARALRAID